MDPVQTIGAVCSRSKLFASILNLSVMLGNYLLQTTSADDIFRCVVFLGALRVNINKQLLTENIVRACATYLIAWLVPSLELETLNLGVLCSNPTLDRMQITMSRGINIKHTPFFLIFAFFSHFSIVNQGG